MVGVEEKEIVDSATLLPIVNCLIIFYTAPRTIQPGGSGSQRLLRPSHGDRGVRQQTEAATTSQPTPGVPSP